MTAAVLNQIHAILAAEPRTCLHVISCQTGLSLRTVHKVLRDQLKLKKRPAKWIPRMLTDQQRNRRLRMARQILGRFTRSPTLQDRVITGNESWFWGYDPVPNNKSASWLAKNDPRPHKAVKNRYRRKVIEIVFWDSTRVIMKHIVPQGRGVNAAFYLRVMRHL